MIPFNRMIMYLLFLGIFPLFFVIAHFCFKHEELELLDHQLSSALDSAIKKTHEERYNKLIRKQFANVDHHYIDNQVEKLPLMQSEIDELKKALNQGFHSHENQIKQRLQQLTNGQNTVSFVESPVKNYRKFQETLESMARSVEVDASDLACILSRIEGVQILDFVPSPLRPHLIISECKIERKKGTVFEDYSLHIKIIKREYQK